MADPVVREVGTRYNKEGEPFEYNATGAYREIMEKNRGPRNIPPGVMNRIQAQLIAAIRNDPMVHSSSLASHVGEVEVFHAMTDVEKKNFISDCKDESLLLSLKIREEDTDVLDMIVVRIRELRALIQDK